jgi:D-alanyl-D-alanine dipeptidase
MTLEEKLQRSKSTEKIDHSKFQSINKQDPLVKVSSTDKILVAPNWTIPGDFEGGMYADYISEHPEYDGIYVRAELLKRLESAANSLANPYQLVIRAGHRPIAVQRRLLKECAEEYKTANPGVSDEEALEYARTFVSDPDREIPPHVCGAAVDVELIDSSTGKYLGFGSAMNENNEKSFLYHQDLSAEQKANRLMLLTAMLDAGFASCMSEWWHFSYGDQTWAWFYGNQESLYSRVAI